MEAAIAWADKHGRDGAKVGSAITHRRAEVVRMITPTLPSHRLNVVHVEVGEPAICFVLGSSLMEHEIRLSQSVKRIKKFQDVLGTTEPPRWFKTGSLSNSEFLNASFKLDIISHCAHPV